MKKRLSRGAKLGFAAPFLLLAVVGAVRFQLRPSPDSIVISDVSEISSLQFSPDGKRVLASVRRTTDQSVGTRIYDVESRSEICRLAAPTNTDFGFPPNAEIYRSYATFAWSGDGTRLVSNSNVFSAQKSVWAVDVWDARTGTVQVNQPYQQGPNFGTWQRLRFSTDGKTLTGDGSPPALFNASTGKRLDKPAPTPQLPSGTWSKLNSKLGLRVSYDDNTKQFKVTDTKTKSVVWKIQVANVSQLSWQGDVLALRDNIYYQNDTRRGENAVLLWNGKTRQQLPSPPVLSRGEIGQYSFNSDGRIIAYFVAKSTPAGQKPINQGELVVWDYVANRVAWRTEWNNNLFAIQWSPDGEWLTVGENYNNQAYKLSLFDKNGNLQFQHKQVSHSVAWSPDSKMMAYGVYGKGLWRYFLTNRIEVRHFED